MSRLIGSTTASPSGTASAPPGQKSFWTSTTIRPSMGAKYSQAMRADPGTLSQDIQSVLLPAEVAMTLRVRGATKAGVLVPLYVEHGELHAVFTKRREDLRRHPGE